MLPAVVKQLCIVLQDLMLADPEDEMKVGRELCLQFADARFVPDRS